jgi:hypothetical protein
MDALPSVPMLRPSVKWPRSSGVLDAFDRHAPQHFDDGRCEHELETAVTKQSLEIALNGGPAVNGWMVGRH